MVDSFICMLVTIFFLKANVRGNTHILSLFSLNTNLFYFHKNLHIVFICITLVSVIILNNFRITALLIKWDESKYIFLNAHDENNFNIIEVQHNIYLKILVM